MKRIATLLLLLCTLCPLAAAEEIDVYMLSPAAIIPEAKCSEQTAALYCGPTQGSYRHEEHTIDLSQPYVCFGQHDSWAMVAQGTPDSFGPVGWVEAALIDIPYEPQLTFEDGFLAMIEENTVLTDDPCGASSLIELARGAQVIVLAQYEGWLYVQSEIDGAPVRAFVMASSIF